MSVKSTYVSIFLLIVFSMCAFRVQAADFSQSNWIGGSGQTSFTDGTKFLRAGNLVTTTANQLRLDTNYGTGFDGPCLVTQATILDGTANFTCSGRSTADAASFKISKLLPTGATSITVPNLLTLSNPISIVSSGNTGYAPSAAFGPDGFLRIVYYDLTDTSIKYVRCTDANCSQLVTTKIESITTVNIFGSFTSLKIGTDGLARFAYHNEDTKALKYAVCNNDDCTAPAITNILSIGSGGNAGKFASLALDSSNNGHIAYHRGTGSSNGGRLEVATYVGSGGTGCTSSAWTCVIVESPGGYTNVMTLGPDGNPLIGENVSDASFIDHLHYIRCTNVTCSTKSITIVDPAADVATDVGYGMSMAFGSDGLPRFTYFDYTNSRLKFARCTNVSCSTNTISIIDSIPHTYIPNSIILNNDDLPEIVYRYGGSNGVRYAKCNDQNCTSAVIKVITTNASNTPVIVKTADDNQNILYYDGVQNDLVLVPKSAITTVGSQIATGDEVLIMNDHGTASDFSKVGLYETHYITGISGTTVSLDTPLVRDYDGTTQNILLQRIPQYTNVSFQSNLPSNGLVGYWKLNESSYNGTSGEVRDSSGNGSNGVSVNGTTTAKGHYGYGALFDGVNDSITLPHNSNLSVSNTFTVSLWMKPNDVTTQSVISKGSWSGGWDIIMSTAAVGWDFRSSCFGSVDNYLGSKTNIPAGQWALYTFTYDAAGGANNFKIYINGVLDTQATVTGSACTNSTNISLGSSVDQNTFKGMMDDVRIYNRTLSSTEVSTLYNAPSLSISPYSADTGLGGVLFIRAQGTISLDETSILSAEARGYTGGATGTTTGGTGGLTYNGIGGTGGQSNSGATTTASTLQGGGGGGKHWCSENAGAAGSIGGGGGGGGSSYERSGGGGGGGYATVGAPGHNDTGYAAPDPGAASGSTGGNGGGGGCDAGGAGGGGGTYGAASLTNAYFGSGGGGGGSPNGGTTTGGNGGGFLFVVANTITNSQGNISSDGGSGHISYPGFGGGGGGGGAGGSIVLKALHMTLDSSFVTANGGVGGPGGDAGAGGPTNLTEAGGAGGLGRIALYSPNSIAGSTVPAAATASGMEQATSGVVRSSVFDSGQASSWGAVTFSATTPANTSVLVRVRTSNNPDMSGAADFGTCPALTSGTGVTGSCIHDGDRYAQYEITLISSDANASPVFNSFKLEYGPYGQTGTAGKSDPGPNAHENWSKPVDAGNGFVGDIKPLTRVEAPGASILIPNDAAHDPLSVSIALVTKPSIAFPWNQGFSTLNGDFYLFSMVSAFNGFPVLMFDKPVTITLPYNPVTLKGRNPKTLKILWYNPQTKRWTALSTPNVVDTDKHTVSNVTKYVGYFAVGYGNAKAAPAPKKKRL